MDSVSPSHTTRLIRLLKCTYPAAHRMAHSALSSNNKRLDDYSNTFKALKSEFKYVLLWGVHLMSTHMIHGQQNHGTFEQ